jgi:hypothetical protein
MQTGACAIGSTLLAIGEKAVSGLFAAARNGLGLLAKPIPLPQSIVHDGLTLNVEWSDHNFSS